LDDIDDLGESNIIDVIIRKVILLNIHVSPIKLIVNCLDLSLTNVVATCVYDYESRQSGQSLEKTANVVRAHQILAIILESYRLESRSHLFKKPVEFFARMLMIKFLDSQMS